jgi:arylsulfatase A-like enzyme
VHHARIQKNMRNLNYLIWVCLCLLFSSCTDSETGSRARHVIFISLDTTRPDHIGCYGNPWISTPNLDRLAGESILFTQYMTVVPTTLPSHTSLFTGKYPHRHGNPQNGYMVNKENVMLAEILKGAGYKTLGFIGSFALDSRFDFAQGFDHYDQSYERFVGDGKLTEHERSASSVTQSVISHLKAWSSRQPLFLFAHYFDPHKPFDPPAPYDTMYRWEGAESVSSDKHITVNYPCPHALSDEHWQLSKQAALGYAGEISYMDHHLGKLLDYVQQKGILDDAILVVTSDHGENFWEHMPYFHHGTSTHQTSMHAVCMIRLPDAAHGGTIVNQPLSSIDILPTVLAYLHLPAPDGIDGRPFDLHNCAASIGDRVIYGQATLTSPWKAPAVASGWQHANKARCVRSGNLVYMQAPFASSEELYDLSSDPYEQNNLLSTPSPRIASLVRELKQKLETWAASADPLESFPEKAQREETVEKLKALGYL